MPTPFTNVNLIKISIVIFISSTSHSPTTSVVDITTLNTAITYTSITKVSTAKAVCTRQLAYPYPIVGQNASGKAATKQPKMKQQSTLQSASSSSQSSSAGQPNAKENPKMLVCVNCKKMYNPETVQFGSCRMHKGKYGRAYPDQVTMDHWRNSTGDDQGKDMWLCCGNEDKNHPGCMEWVHCQK
ncbi:hypothetical protein DL771_010171 [Monosporascus sp. 5C6A]|nr:hypothetical protein DL771_010171 [Monosporascus sp. 5C6A]